MGLTAIEGWSETQTRGNLWAMGHKPRHRSQAEVQAMLSALPLDHRNRIEMLRSTIQSADPEVQEMATTVMGQPALAYMQHGEIKYAFTSTSRALTFHNLVMYCYPELREHIQQEFPQLKYRKSCINVKEPSSLTPEIVGTILDLSSSYTYPKQLSLL